jgi:hypothetical protein
MGKQGDCASIEASNRAEIRASNPMPKDPFASGWQPTPGQPLGTVDQTQRATPANTARPDE